MLKNRKYETFFSYWIEILIISLAIMIIVGGLTRLTDSGLSITKWELFKGIIPPLNSNDWDYYFSLYKTIPQYNLINKEISLNEFKIIYYWEYAHRLLGRFIGLLFLVPLIFLIYKNVLSKSLQIKLIGIFVLIFIQGIIGWYMVQSGLIDKVSVSHYRLSIHLLLAFVILSSLFWIYLNYKKSVNKSFFNLKKNFLSIKILFFFIFLQIILGAFVSGLDAGKIYQTWPLMNGGYFPNDFIALNIIDYFDFNNHSLVQFFHRNLAYLIFILTIYIGIIILKHKKEELFKPYFLFFFIILIQIFLGIMVLLTSTNLYFASLHQISTIFLIVSSLNLYHNSLSS